MHEEAPITLAIPTIDAHGAAENPAKIPRVKEAEQVNTRNRRKQDSGADACELLIEDAFGTIELLRSNPLLLITPLCQL